jgi:hypothetical protein
MPKPPQSAYRLSKRSRLALVAIGSVLVVAAPSLANHPSTEVPTGPSYRDDGLALTATGLLTGLEDSDVRVTVRARAEVLGSCRSQDGHEIAITYPSEARSVVTEYGSNGMVEYSVTTVEPESPVPGAPACPDPTWEQTVLDVNFSDVTILAEQSGTVVYSRIDVL